MTFWWDFNHVHRDIPFEILRGELRPKEKIFWRSAHTVIIPPLVCETLIYLPSSGSQME